MQASNSGLQISFQIEHLTGFHEFKQFDMHAEFNTFLDQKSLACKFVISTIQTLNLSLHCTYPKLSCSMKVNKEELLIHIFQGTNNTDDMYRMRQTVLQVCVILMWHVGMFSG